MGEDKLTSHYDDKTALITGGTSGVGLATARLLVDRGARVLVTGRDEANLRRAADQLDDRALTVASDTSNLTDLDDLAEHTRTHVGGLDLLFLNAGITRFVSVEDMTEAVYDELFAINTKGVFFACQRLLPLMNPDSAIVLTTSIAAAKGLAMSSAYAASKAAVRSMARSFARELQPRGIRVNAVSPGPIDTGILERALPAEAATGARDQMLANNPMSRFGRPEEVAEAVAFLAFHATFTTGAELVVDGGASQL